MDLFNVLAGWKRHHVAEGVVLLPPAGMSAGAIQIRERVRPLRSLKTLLDEAATRLPPALRVNVTVGVAERFVNSSGEYVALGSFTSRHGDAVHEQMIAMILADDWYVSIDGMVSDTALAASVREAVRMIATNYYTGLGEVRQRPYLYTPPAGWRAVRHARETIYYGPRHPKQRAVIHVFHARPVKMTTAETQDRLLMCETSLIQEKDPPLPAKTFTTKFGLFGEMIKQTGRDAEGRKIESYKTMLVDKRFLYLSRLDTEYDAENAGLSDYVAMIERVVPVPTAPVDRHAAVIHWSD